MGIPDKIWEKYKSYHDSNKCDKCGRPIDDGYTYCYYCEKEGDCDNIDRGYFVLTYKSKNYLNDSFSKELIKFKENKGDSYIPTLIKLHSLIMDSYLKNIEVLIPVPPRKNSKRDRHSPYIISSILSNVLKLPKNDSLVYFNKETKSQKKLSYRERIKNVKGAFSLNDTLKADNLLLIDDLFTTGATLNEMSRTLKSNGAKIIDIFCVGRAVKNYDE